MKCITITPRKDPSLFPLTLIMLPVYFINRNHPRWVGLGPFNKFERSILASRIEKSPLKSHMQRNKDSRDQTLKICFAYLFTPCIWYRDETGWMATSLSRIALMTNGWSILPPGPWPTLNSEPCWGINEGILGHKKNQIEVILLKTTQDYLASDSQPWLPTRIIWGAFKAQAAQQTSSTCVSGGGPWQQSFLTCPRWF